MSISEIKTMAKEAVRKEARGVSALTLIKTARYQLVTAKDYESQGNLKGALSAITKAASLAQMTMDTAEFAYEVKGKGGVLRKEFTEFLEDADFTGRTAAVEEKLKAFEKLHPHPNGTESENKPINKLGGSIADRMKALEQNGLKITTGPRKQSFSNGSSVPSATSLPSRFLSLMPPSSISPSPHSIICPPSPSSSPPSSPLLTNLSDFKSTYPSIDELDENPAFSLLSIPTGLSSGSNKSSPQDMSCAFTSDTESHELPPFSVEEIWQHRQEELAREQLRLGQKRLERVRLQKARTMPTKDDMSTPGAKSQAGGELPPLSPEEWQRQEELHQMQQEKEEAEAEAARQAEEYRRREEGDEVDDKTVTINGLAEQDPIALIPVPTESRSTNTSRDYIIVSPFRSDAEDAKVFVPSFQPSDLIRKRTDESYDKLDVNRQFFTSILRRALLAGRREADNILNSLTLSTAVLVMGWLEREMNGRTIILETLPTSISAYKKACMRCMQRLSNTHRILPQSFYMLNVVQEGTRALTGGGFADIWKGRVEGREVCLKVLRLFTTEDNRDKILKQCFREALVWKQLDHPNVLPFLGVNEKLFAPSFCLISPWHSHGNLMVYLEKHPGHDRGVAIRQVADAMCYLHEFDPPVIHADIRGANILVGDDLRCYLADFGLASISDSFSSTTAMSVHTRGSIRWMAPEVLMSTLTDHDNHEHAPAERCPRDVYAFGCTILEIYTGKPPFSQYSHDIRVATEVMAGQRPSRPEGVFSDEAWSLMESCWAHDPSQRPSARDILASL